MQQLIDLRNETPEAISLQAIGAFMEVGRPAVVLFSGGKDSSVLLNLALTAAVEQARQGRNPMVVIAHSDVGVENPEIQRLVSGEIAKAARFAREHGVTAVVRVATPAFWDTFPVRVIGGRALPTFPDSRRDCQTDLKRLPNERELALIERELVAKGCPQPVLMTGVRRDESAVRAASVKGRGEKAVSLWTDTEGRLRLSPLLEWAVDDVWQYLGLANAGVIPSYSRFEETMQTYQAAGGSSCVVVADAEMQKHSKPCSSRFGCWVCTAVREDKSLRQMIETDRDRYGYMAPLAALRDFIAYTQYDWSRRQYVGRSIVDGFIEVGADTYSPAMLAELLRYALSAQKLSGVPIISAAQLIAIDARWSQYAIAEPFSALRIWKQVEDGALWTPPPIKPYPKTAVPKLGKIHVGDWNDDVTSALEVTGLRNPAWEDFSETCGPGLRKTTVNVSIVGTQPDSGATILSLTPRHAGDSPVVVFAAKPEGLSKGQVVEDLDSFSTTEGTLYFQARDPSGQHETGSPVRWTADLKIRHQVQPAGDKRTVTLACTPKAELSYSLDGSNPRDGLRYDSPFEIGTAAARVLVYARAGEANKSADFQIPASGDKTVHINDTKPVKLQPKRIGLDTTDRVFGVINRFRDQPGTLFKGVRIEIGEGEKTVTVRFQEREVNASIIEGVVNNLRQLLAEDQAPVVVSISDGAHFDTGFAAKEFAKLVGLELKPGDVVQED